MADIAFLAIASTDGKFGSVRTGNVSFFARKGITGLYAPRVTFTGPVYIGNISAFDEATPVLLIGSAADVRITGGDLANERPVRIGGVRQLRFTDGTDSTGALLRAQANQAVLWRDDMDVTAETVANP